MAEGQGFEPWRRSHVQQFSRLPHSTALPSLHAERVYEKGNEKARESILFHYL